MATIKTLAAGVSPYPAAAAEPTVLVTTANGRPSTVAADSAVGAGATVIVNGQAALNGLITTNQSGVFDGANITINLEEQNFNTTNQVTATTNYPAGNTGEIQYNSGANSFASDAYFTYTNSNVVTPGIRTNNYLYANGSPFTAGGNAAIGNFVFSGDVMSISDANSTLSITGNGTGNIRLTSNSNIWTFNNVGNLTLPSNTSSINYANGSPYGGGNYSNSNVSGFLAAFGSNVVSTTGNISAGYFIGNGSQLTGVASGYGNANVVANLAALGSNPVSTTGNITAATINANLYTAPGNVTVTANTGNTWTFATSGNLVFPSGMIIQNQSPNTRILTNTGRLRITATDNAYVQIGWQSNIAGTGPVAKIYANGIDTGQPSNVVIKTGSFAATTYDWVFGNTGNLAAPGRISATNIVTNSIASDDSSFVTIEDGVNVNGEISATGNMTGNYFIGNGSQLTGLASSYGNANVVANLAALGSNPVSTTGNITGNYFIGNGSQLTGISASLPLSNGTSNINIVTANGNVTVVSAGNTWTFGTDRTLTVPASNSVPGQISAQTADNGRGYDLRISAGNTNGCSIAGGDMYLSAGAGYGGVAWNAGNVNIVTGDRYSNPTGNTWRFDALGNLNLPGNTFAVNYANGSLVTFTANTGNVTFSGEIVIGTGTSNLISGLYLAPSSSSANANMYLRVRGNIIDEPTHIHFDTGNNAYYNQFIGDDNKYILLANTGNIVINANNNLGNSAQWTFDTDGNLSAPGNISAINLVINSIRSDDSTFVTIEDGVNVNGEISATGNITGNYILGNGSQLTGLPAPTVTQDITSNGAMSIMTYDGVIKYVNYATVEASSGNITGGNILTPGLISAAGNITGGNILGNGRAMTGILFSNTSDATTASLTVDDFYLSAVTALNVSAANSAGYQFDQYPGTNPTIYATAGSTLAFRLAVAGHPFLIQSSGANYSTGLNHVTTAGTVTTAASAQGQVAGTLYWKIPGNVVGTYTYQCSVHGGMVGNIVVSSPTEGTFASLSVTGNITGGNVLFGSGIVSGTGNITGGNLSVTGNVTGNTAGFTIGYLNVPQVSFAGNATIAATDAGKHYYSVLSTANVLTIANNTSVTWQVGTAISLVNRGTGNITVAQGTGVSLYLAGNSSTGNRTVATYGMATLLNVAANIWMINGTGVT